MHLETNMPIKAKIIKKIKQTGPINIADYMDICLNDAQYGYYKKQTIFGKKGDFVTSPEICQTFGEMLAIWAIASWQQLNKPPSFNFCEMGPGRGTLMSDMIRTFLKICPEFLNAANIILIESSEQLKHQQKQLLAPYINESININWMTHFLHLPQKPIILIANELLDALPIEQYIYQNNAFFMRKITLNKQNELEFVIDDTPANIKNYINFLPEEAIVEVSPTQEKLITNISEHISKYSGFALFIDYGELKPCYQDSLQAVKNHKYANIFESPGKADLTSHINFYNLAKIAQKYNCNCFGKTQSEFLTSLGICERGKILKKHAIDRLINPQAMGTLFKVMAISNSNNVPFNFNEGNKII